MTLRTLKVAEGIRGLPYIIVGNLGRDPEARTLASGDTVTDFSVATSERRRTPDGGTQETTTWFRVSAFGRLGEVAQQYLRKGSSVYVEGTLTQRDWTGSDGQNRSTLEVRARDLRMLDRKEEAAPALAAVGAGIGAARPGGADDVPF